MLAALVLKTVGSTQTVLTTGWCLTIQAWVQYPLWLQGNCTLLRNTLPSLVNSVAFSLWAVLFRHWRAGKARRA